jgi:hypothetical protein
MKRSAVSRQLSAEKNGGFYFLPFHLSAVACYSYNFLFSKLTAES